MVVAVYEMGPRSWRPDSSLGSAVDVMVALEDLPHDCIADPEVEQEARVAYSLHQPR